MQTSSSFPQALLPTSGDCEAPPFSLPPHRPLLPDINIIAIAENDTIKLPIHSPDGTSVEILLPDAQANAKP